MQLLQCQYVTISKDLNIVHVYELHAEEKQLKAAKMSQKSSHCVSLFALGPPASWFELILKRRFEESTASNRNIKFSWRNIIIKELLLRSLLIQNLYDRFLSNCSCFENRMLFRKFCGFNEFI